jgi:Protein of unknown function (DUF559)
MFDQPTIAAWAGENHGLLERGWLLLAGVTEHEIKGRVRSGQWLVVHPGVYRLAGAPVTWQQRLHAACLAAGPAAAVSHRAALAWYGLDGVTPGIVEVAVRRPQWPRLDGVLQVHRSTDLCPRHVVVRESVRVTSPVRTLIDIGAIGSARFVGRAYRHAVGKRLVTRGAVERELSQLGRKGRRGVGVMRKVLAEHGGPATVSGFLGGKGEEILRDYGIPLGVAEYEVYAGDRFVAKVDRAWPAVRFCVEWDGDERHMGNTAADVERENALREAGWDFRRFAYRHVMHDREYVARTILRGLHPLLVTAGALTAPQR